MCDRKDWPNQLYRTGYESGAGCEIRSGTNAIELISWAASEGSTVSSLICDRWMTGKLATFMGSTDSPDVRLRRRGWTYSEPERRGLVAYQEHAHARLCSALIYSMHQCPSVMLCFTGIGVWAHLAACASRDETSPGPTMDYGTIVSMSNICEVIAPNCYL